MTSLPGPTEVAGKHYGIYEAYYKQVDPKGAGTIDATTAAKFLKKSGLSDVVLSRIWDLSDPNGRGCLDKAGLFVALKLVSLAQHGHNISMANILMEPPNPPKVGEIPKVIPQSIQSVPPSNTDWTMKPVDRLKYEQLFDSLQPVNDLIAGAKVKGVLMESKLPLETLGKIWDLADQDRDGNLDKHEFTVAMHLVYQALDKRAVPTTLPPELQKPKIPKAPSGDNFADGGFVANFPKDIGPPPAVPPPPVIKPQMTSAVTLLSTELTGPLAAPISPAPLTMNKINTTTVAGAHDWVVTPADRARFEIIFRECDKDKDGLVCGGEIKTVFLQSGVPQQCLALIWALCDTNQSGKLTFEQFALAMWLVERKKRGIDPPETLSENMIPPSLRGIIPGANVTIQPELQRKFSNPELEMISKDIDEIARERNALELELKQKEADVRIKSGEIRSLQSELDTLTQTLKQLEHQRGEAQKRLDELMKQVTKIREQCLKQEETINEQEGEINSKRSELQKLKDEESALEKEYDTNRKLVDNLSTQLQEKQLHISQFKAMITTLLENQRQMNDAILLCKAALESNDPYLVSDYSLNIEVDIQEARDTLEKLNRPAPSLQDEIDPFNENSNNGFGNETKDAFGSNGFGGSDPFTSTATVTGKSGFDDSFMNQPFEDSFGSSFLTSTKQVKDPFMSASNADLFGDKKATGNETVKDDFNSDPFAILHAPTSGQVLSPSPVGQRSGPPPRPESPSPALPPKKSKQPPPRPAPPRPLQGPTRPAPPVSSDLAFGSSSGGFADFSDFDNKQFSLEAFVPSKSLSVVSTVATSKTTTSNTSPTTTTMSKSVVKHNDSDKLIMSTTETKNATNLQSKYGNAPTDFTEDPFKNYRYEDVFGIKDPFDDDNENGNIDKIDLFQSAFDDKIQKTPTSLDAAFPDFSNKNNNSNEKLNTTNFMNAFDDNFNDDFKNTNTNNDFASFDDFSNFDTAFESKTDTTTNINENKLTTTITTTAAHLNSKEKKNTSILAPPPPATKKSSSTIPIKFNIFNKKDSNKIKNLNKNTNNNDNDFSFADEDDYDENDGFNKIGLNTQINLDKSLNKGKLKENAANLNNIPEKFRDDYSNPDNFASDIEAAILKSLNEK